jgi:hypothetical protein
MDANLEEIVILVLVNTHSVHAQDMISMRRRGDAAAGICASNPLRCWIGR